MTQGACGPSAPCRHRGSCPSRPCRGKSPAGRGRGRDPEARPRARFYGAFPKRVPVALEDLPEPRGESRDLDVTEEAAAAQESEGAADLRARVVRVKGAEGALRKRVESGVVGIPPRHRRGVSEI